MGPSAGNIQWSPDLAYVVGLITTDGSLSKDGRHIDFISKDKDLIKTFQKCLGLNNKISPKKSGYTGRMSSFRMQFGSVALHKWLCDIGLMPNKSKRLGELDIPDRLFFDFLRGHLDGDGYIKKYFDPIYPKSLRLYVNFMSASLPHLRWIDRTIKRLVGLKGFYRKQTKGVGSYYYLNFSKLATISLLHYLYPRSDVPCLRRKLIRAKQFLI